MRNLRRVVDSLLYVYRLKREVRLTALSQVPLRLRATYETLKALPLLPAGWLLSTVTNPWWLALILTFSILLIRLFMFIDDEDQMMTIVEEVDKFTRQYLELKGEDHGQTEGNSHNHNRSPDRPQG